MYSEIFYRIVNYEHAFASDYNSIEAALHELKELLTVFDVHLERVALFKIACDKYGNIQNQERLF